MIDVSLSRFLPFSSKAIAIDLGTANTVVYLRGSGIIASEPSVVAMETVNGVRRVRAVGSDAKLMMGKTPESIRTIRPLRSGVIADLEVAATPPGAMPSDQLSELRDALFAARENPRDVDTIVDLTRRIDALVALVIAYDRALAAIERSLETLRNAGDGEG